MWDVKKLFEQEDCFADIRFISTMWDVKLFRLLKYPCNQTFYLDYVGCKAVKDIENYNFDESFISTMWDVKLEFQYH